MRHLALLCLLPGIWGCNLPAAAPPRDAAAPRGVASPLPTSPTGLTPGAGVEREIAPGERHEYLLPLEAGQYVHIVLEHRPAEPEATLARPDGRLLAEAGAGPWEGQRVLSAVVEAAGEHRIAVSLAAGAPAGSYILRLTEARRATPEDRHRVAAERALSAALARLDGEGTTAAVLAGLETARDLYRQAGDAAGEVDAVNEMGSFHYSAGSYAEAIAAAQAALARAREVGYTRGEALSLFNLGVALQRDRVDEALEVSNRALALWTALGDVRLEAATHLSIGYCLYYSHREGAEEHLSRALAGFERVGNAAGQAQVFNTLALMAQERDASERALELFGRALELARRSGDRSVEASVLRNVVNLRRSRGEFQEALAGYAAVLEIDQRNQATRVRTLHDQASLYFVLGDLDKAEDNYRRVIELLPDEDQDAVHAVINLGAVFQAHGQPEAALEQYERALAHAGDERPRQQALALQWIGRARLELGRPAAALPPLAQALELWRQTGSRTGQVTTLVSTAEALKLLGRAEEAAAPLAEALAISRASQDPSRTASCLLAQARLDRDAGRLAEARAGIEEALALVEAVRHRVTDDGLRASFFATKRSYYEFYVDLLMRLEQREPGRSHAAAALAASERARARGLLDLLAEGKIDVEEGVDPDLKVRETDLSHELAWTQTQLARERAASQPDAAKVERLNRRLLDLEGELEVLQGEIRDRNPRYAQVRYPVPLDAGAIRGLLGERTALLEYALGEEGSYLFAVTRERVEVHRLPPAGTIRSQVEALHGAIAQQQDQRRLRGLYVKQASALYQTLLAPAAEVLAGKRELLIAPDGVLYQLPFEALLAGGPAASLGLQWSELPYLLRHYAVAYVPSASVLAAFRAPRGEELAAGGKRLVAYANPVYGTAQRAAPVAEVRVASAKVFEPQLLDPLPGTDREVKGIASLFRQDETKLYLRAEATEANVKANPLLATARRIHFATHGFVDERRPQLSGLALSPSAEPGEDGVLRVHEIFNLKLTADLVVLSACDTGRGKQVGGEGLVGLTRAFFYAGAPSLAVSLWQASEDSTPELMIGFYRRLESAAGKGEALRQAKLELISGGRFAHPFYWAPFVLIGDPH